VRSLLTRDLISENLEGRSQMRAIHIARKFR
jgi:hypothetical protein